MRERDNIPVMLLGLKRDLRVEEEGVIYPQEVSEGVSDLFSWQFLCSYVCLRDGV